GIRGFHVTGVQTCALPIFVRQAFATRSAVFSELERGLDVTVVLHCIPLLESGAVSGALLLVRDISELRRRDRLLLSKDATIRERSETRRVGEAEIPRWTTH